MTAFVATATRRRSAFGVFCKWSFIGFNFLMLVWLLSTFGALAEGNDGAIHRATTGSAMIGTIWIFGAVLLGIVMVSTRGPLIRAGPPGGVRFVIDVSEARPPAGTRPPPS
ncbi:hypothetical protein L1787_09065 [Acuticoccus sp. M5D2P5]|uniref:hypothetical protein n=1 Tax=Acuticoccus kalidii TaxID=2910977 RepID=UPI001F1905DD|nr:hypothetical protein [Acuticoccus kalidii]MCF3933559.1 hypothetical protein [Acuticoccus kalidii]